MDGTPPGTPSKGFNPGSKMTPQERADLDHAIARAKQKFDRLEIKIKALEGSLQSKDKHGTQRTRPVYSSPQSVPKQRLPATSHYLVPELPQAPLSLTSRIVSFSADLQNVNRASPEDPLQRPPRIRTPTPDYPMADQAAAGLKSPVHRTPRSRAFDVVPDSAADNTAVERFLHRELELRTPDKNMPRESDHSDENTAVRRYLLKTLEHRVQARETAGTSDTALSLEDANNESARQRASSPTPSSSAFQSETTHQSSRTLTRSSDSDTSEPEQQSTTRTRHRSPKPSRREQVSSFMLAPIPVHTVNIIKRFCGERALLSTIVASIVSMPPPTNAQFDFYKTCLKRFPPVFAADLVNARDNMMSDLSEDNSDTARDLQWLLNKMITLPIFMYRLDNFAQCEPADIRKQTRTEVKHLLITNNIRALNKMNKSMGRELQSIKSMALQILAILNQAIDQQDDTTDSESLSSRTAEFWL